MDLGQFLKQRDIVYTLCAVTLSGQLIIIIDLLTTSIIVPLINKKRDKNNSIENFTINLNGANLEVGKMFVALIRLILVFITLYILYYFFC